MMENFTRDYMLQMANEISRLRAENEKLREENWEHIARGYALVGMLPDETLVGEIQDARRIIGGIVDNLRAENEKLRAALKPFADIAPKYDPPEGDDDQPLYDTRHFPTIGMVRTAAAALKETGDE